MSITFVNPPGVHDSGGRYSHAAVVPTGLRRVVVSGQVGMAADGTVPEDPGAQIAQAFANLRTVLASQGAGPAQIVKLTVFLTDRAHVAAYREARVSALDGHAPASTLLIVAGLADPRWVVEIEGEAAS